MRERTLMPPRRNQTSQVVADYAERIVANDGARTPQLMTTIPILVPDAATSDIDTVLLEKFEVVDMTCIKRNGAGAGNTMQLKDGSNNNITDAVACATDDALTRAATITDTGDRHIIAKGGTLRLTATRAAGTRNCLVLVHGFIRP